MKCSRCKVDKEPQEFITGKTRCLECYRKAKEYYKANREHEIERAKKSQRNRGRIAINAVKRESIRKNPVSYMLWSIKTKAKNHDIPFNLSHEDIVIPEKCPILGLVLKIGDGNSTASSPSIDRIIPEKGYVKGNIQVISHRANTIKSDATLAELRLVVDYMTNLLEDNHA